MKKLISPLIVIGFLTFGVPSNYAFSPEEEEALIPQRAAEKLLGKKFVREVNRQLLTPKGLQEKKDKADKPVKETAFDEKQNSEKGVDGAGEDFALNEKKKNSLPR